MPHLDTIDYRKPCVAVLLATYNGLPWIFEQIDSILCQIGVDVVLFIGDDGSTDSTMEELRAAYSSDSRIIFLDDGTIRYGSPAANFIRIFQTVSFRSFDFVFLADQDDYWYSEKIISAIQLMTIEGCDCYASDLNCLYPSGRRKRLRKSYPQTENDFLFQGASAGCTYGLSRQAAEVCKSKFLLMSKENKDSASHDCLIYAITQSHSFGWIIDNNVYIDYRQHAGNAYGALGIASYSKRWKLLKSGWYRNNVIALSEVCSLTANQRQVVDALRSWRIKDKAFLLSRSWTFRRNPLEKFYMSLLILTGLL